MKNIQETVDLFVKEWESKEKSTLLCKAVRLRSKSVSKRMIKKIDILLSDWFGDKLYNEFFQSVSCFIRL